MDSLQVQTRTELIDNEAKIAMDEEQFRQKLRHEGYGEPVVYDLEPQPEKEMYDHDHTVAVFVVSGEFSMIFENGTKVYRSGDWFENEAGILHTERIGPKGAVLIMARK